ncbi:hypothetical protein Droror1_Dr00002548 [Drosera rotundifolia]
MYEESAKGEMLREGSYPVFNEVDKVAPRMGTGNSFGKVSSLYERVLSALIEEDDSVQVRTPIVILVIALMLRRGMETGLNLCLVYRCRSIVMCFDHTWKNIPHVFHVDYFHHVSSVFCKLPVGIVRFT